MRLFLCRFPALGGLRFFFLLCAAMGGVPTANAATLIVTKTTDSGPGSLRQALADANNGDTIQFDPALNGQAVTLTSAELVIHSNVTIDGPGPNLLTIKRDQQAPLFRIFHVMSGTAPLIRSLTIAGGAATDARGGGIFNEGALGVVNCSIHDNVSLGGLAARGGGVYNSGTVTINQSTISNNGSLAGGGVWNIGQMEINNSAITGNHAYQVTRRGGDGGGIANYSGTLAITDSVVSGNRAGEPNPFPTPVPSVTPFPVGFGGGIEHYASSTLTIRHSVISDNSVTGTGLGGQGGGIFVGGADGPLNITDSTIDNNHADTSGGGVSGGGTRSIQNSTISGNTASGGGGIAGGGTITNSTISGNTADQGGGISGSFITITNSTISANQGGGIVAFNALEIANTILKAGASGANISEGTVTSLGYNLSSDNGGGFLTGPGDQINTDPILGPLQDNGGPTFTHELLTGSPAVNAGDPNFTPPPSTDQRGYLRVFNGRIDIGSLEVQPTPAPTPTGTPSPASPRALNISTRLRVETGDRVGIGGFIITGSALKQVLLRGIGPSLAQFGVPNVLADPVMELHGPAGFTTIVNDNWRDTQATMIIATGIPPSNDLESAILVTLAPGAYTAIVKGNNDTSGVGLVEVYDLGPAASKLANISTRGFVGTGANVMIGGFILGGGANSQIEIFGIGPSLAASGVGGVLADPTLELRDSNGALLAFNDNCGAISIRTLDPAEACIEVSLPPGLFTVILAGKNGGTGVGLVEIYNLD